MYLDLVMATEKNSSKNTAVGIIISVLLLTIPFACQVVKAQQATTTNAAGGWRDLGHLGIVNKDTGILRNEQGVFIPWNKICNAGQQFLLQSCSDLVDSSTGNLTPAGDKAADCINNGLAAGVLAVNLGISPDVARSLLGLAAGLTGCGGIVDMNKLPASQISQMLQQFMGTSSSPSSTTTTTP
jgi:hypothetical protein